MYSYSLTQWLFFFYFYCFFGWCFESAYVSICERRLVNRGFIRGPFLPLYGSGAIMMLVVSMPFQQYLPLVFLAGCVGATALEYVTGAVMEALFKVRYWDYSHKRFNVKGYICLSSTIAWGFLTILMTRFVHKAVEGFVMSLPEGLLTAIVLVLTIGISADFALSFKAALDLRDVLVKLEETRKDLARIQKRLDVVIALAQEDVENRKEEMEARREELLAQLHSHKDELLTDLFGHKFEDLSSDVEEKLKKLHEEVQERRMELSESLRAELGELSSKYHVSRESHISLSRIQDFFQRDLLRSNPTMSSRKFGEVLEELKQSVQKHGPERQ